MPGQQLVILWHFHEGSHKTKRTKGQDIRILKLNIYY